MLKIKSKRYFERHENEINRYVLDNTEWIHLINKQNQFKQYTTKKQNLLEIDLNITLEKQLKIIDEKKFDLVVITDIYEVTHDIYGFMKTIKTILKSDGKILINSINTKWNLILTIFELFNFKNKSSSRSYIHIKKINSITQSAGFSLDSSFSRQIFPFKLLRLGDFLNNLLEMLFYKFKLGINNYLLFSLKPLDYKEYSKTVIVPAKNEEKNLEPLIKQIPIFKSEYEIIMICAESSDNTINKAFEIKEQNPSLPIKVMIQKTKGKGPGVLEALEVAQHELIAILDSDISVDPNTLNDFFEIIETGRADFVNGTRFVYKMEYGAMRRLNNIGNLVFQFIISLLISINLTDSLCGTKVFKRSLIEKLNKWKSKLKVNDPFGDFDLIFSSAFYGDKILEYPVHYKARVYGTTQISRFSDGIKLLLYFLNSFALFNSSKNVR